MRYKYFSIKVIQLEIVFSRCNRATIKAHVQNNIYPLLDIADKAAKPLREMLSKNRAKYALAHRIPIAFSWIASLGPELQFNHYIQDRNDLYSFSRITLVILSSYIAVSFLPFLQIYSPVVSAFDVVLKTNLVRTNRKCAKSAAVTPSDLYVFHMVCRCVHCQQLYVFRIWQRLICSKPYLEASCFVLFREEK